MLAAIVVGSCSLAVEPFAAPSPSPRASQVAATWSPDSALPTVNARRIGSSWTWHETGLDGRGVAAGGPGWVMVGVEDAKPAAWTSTDGQAWTPATVALPAGASGGSMDLVSAGPGGFVAAGTVIVPGERGQHAAVWSSADGYAWQVLGSGSLFDLGRCAEECPRLESIAAGEAGVLATGYRIAKHVESDAWFLPAGGEWRRLVLPTADDGARVAERTAVVARTADFLVAGALCAPDPEADGEACRGVTWTSADGSAWDGPRDLPSGTQTAALRIVRGGARFVILGEQCVYGCQLAAWAWTDMSIWQRGDLVASGIRSLGSGLLAFAGDEFILIGAGYDFASGADQIDVWRTRYGATWHELPLTGDSFPSPSDIQIVDVAGRPDGAIAIGAGAAGSPGVWTSP